MRIVVVLPVYNSEKDVAECLESLLDQTIKPDEIIVVDDGSTDNTIGICRKYPVRIIKSSHLGRCHARNLGWKNARAEIICFAEADAVYNRKWVEEIRSCFMQQADAVIPEVRCYHINSYLQKCLNQDYRIRFFKYTPFSAWAFKKQLLIESGGYNEYLDQAEERELGNIILEKGYKIKVAKGGILYHKGEPKNFWQFLSRSFSSERRRTRGYLMKRPAEKPWKKMVMFIIFIAMIVLVVKFPAFWPSLPALFIIAYSLSLFKIGFKQRGFWICKWRYLPGIAFYRLVRAACLVFGFIFGEMDKIFLPHKIYRNTSSRHIVARERLKLEDMRVSVVIPVLNEENNILDCLSSLKKQAYKPLEIIMVDDSSTDRTIELALPTNIKILKANAVGKNACRNIGWQYARGNVVVFATARSVYAPDWLEKIIIPLQYFDAALDKREAYDQKSFFARCLQANLEANYAHVRPGCAWAYRRKALEDTGGFDASIEVAAEKDLGRRLLKKDFSIGFAPEAIQYYKGFPGSLAESYRSGLKNSRKRLDYALKNPADFPYFRIIFMVFTAGVIFAQVFFYQEYMAAFITFLAVLICLYGLIFFKQAFIKKGWRYTEKKRYLFGLSAIRLVENFAFISGSLSGRKSLDE